MKAAAYCRFSSDNQREESIDAQLRAIEEYAEKNNIEIVKIYADEAKSPTTDGQSIVAQQNHPLASLCYRSGFISISFNVSTNCFIVPSLSLKYWLPRILKNFHPKRSRISCLFQSSSHLSGP
ncbi:resolvase-like protein [Thermohydrogenium kirishiense]|nr:resolvase-like protein [Thermohydrogenium kirishiense]